MTAIETLMRTAPVIPVLTIERVGDAVAIAEALVAGGLPVLEVTLRTPCALESITAMCDVEGAIVGAGTVNSEPLVGRAIDAGAQFLVSPGVTDRVGRAGVESGIPFLPGVATAGDLMRGLELGLSHFKFFPAMAAGGLPALKSLAGPFRGCRFCPTGGITLANAAEWLAFDPVLCVGGSWLVPKGPIDSAAIKAAAHAASALRD